MADYTDYPQSGNIQGYWPLNEASGNAIDAGPNGNDLTETSGTIATVAEFLTARNCRDIEEGDTEYFAITDAAQTGLNPTSNMTISAWIKMEGNPGAENDCIVSKYLAAGDMRCFALYVDGNNSDKVNFHCSPDGTSGASIESLSADSLVLGIWYFVTGVMDDTGNELRVYINGHQNGSGTAYVGGIADKASEFRIGSMDSGGLWDGEIAEVVFWDTALTAAEIKQAMEVWRP